MSDLPWRPLEAMPRSCGTPLGSATMRASADDFMVDEVLGFEADGEGEHLLVQVRKRDSNTHWVAGQLAKVAGIPSRDVSYAGLKDRHAVTTQWFSLLMTGKAAPDWSALPGDQIEVLAANRHRRKLRIGALRGNRFRIVLREVSTDRSALETRLQQLREAGMPNYFGEQRFGHDYQNLHQFGQVLSTDRRRMDRKLRGLLISAARSQLFNEVLAERIDNASWDRPMTGEYFMLDGSRSGFADDPTDSALEERCRTQDIHPSGPLWGRGLPLVSADAAQLEQTVLAPFEAWRNGLEHLGLMQERRPLRVRLEALRWQFLGEAELALSFFLPAGSFATVLLRELLEFSSPMPC
jgi:tRNA pseudouridine13 synthase